MTELQALAICVIKKWHKSYLSSLHDSHGAQLQKKNTRHNKQRGKQKAVAKDKEREAEGEAQSLSGH